MKKMPKVSLYRVIYKVHPAISVKLYWMVIILPLKLYY